MKHYQLKNDLWKPKTYKKSVTLNFLFCNIRNTNDFFQLKNAENNHYISTRINESAMVIIEA